MKAIQSSISYKGDRAAAAGAAMPPTFGPIFYRAFIYRSIRSTYVALMCPWHVVL